MPDPVFPPALQNGDQVALISPAGPTRDAAASEQGVRRLMRWGLTPLMGSAALQAKGYLAGDDTARLADLQAALDDPSLKAIFCMRGGYGVTRLLPKLDWRGFAKSPKPIVGYSDVTALLAAAHKVVGAVGIHGPMVATKDDLAFDAAGEALQKKLLFDPKPPGRLAPVGGEPAPWTLFAGEAEGPLIGGNLSLLSALQGTPFAPDATGAIVFIEEVEEEPYRIDRMLTQLAQSGFLKQAAGVVFGDFARCNAPGGTEETNLSWVLKDRCRALGIPVATGFPFGHRGKSWSLPYGARAKLDAPAGKPAVLSLLQSAVRVRKTNR